MKDEKRYSYEFAMGEYKKLEKYLGEKSYKSEPSGSLRRKRKDVGDIDFIVMGSKKDILRVVEEYPEVDTRKNKYEFQLKSGICIHTIPEVEERYNFTLWQSTGPKKHVKWIKEIYNKKEEEIEKINQVEKKIYTDIELEYIEPEDRWKWMGEDD